MANKTLFRFRVHTGQHDAYGEQCLLFIGGGLIPDGPEHVWLTSPDGGKILRAKRKDVEPLSEKEVVDSIASEVKLAKAIRNKDKN